MNSYKSFQFGAIVQENGAIVQLISPYLQSNLMKL